MKGLLLKDFYMTVKYCRMIFLIDVFFIAVSFLNRENIVFLVFPTLISGMLPITLLSLDERFKWTQYSAALPYTKFRIVFEKYIIGLLITAATSIFVLICMIIRTSFYNDLSIFGAAIFSVGIFALSVIFPSLCLPLCFKFGTEKGRIAFFILFGLIMSVFAAATEGGNIENIIVGLKGTNPAVVITIGLVSIIAVYIASLAISAAIYKNKEI